MATVLVESQLSTPNHLDRSPPRPPYTLRSHSAPPAVQLPPSASAFTRVVPGSFAQQGAPPLFSRNLSTQNGKSQFDEELANRVAEDKLELLEKIRKFSCEAQTLGIEGYFLEASRTIVNIRPADYQQYRKVVESLFKRCEEVFQSPEKRRLLVVIQEQFPMARQLGMEDLFKDMRYEIVHAMPSRMQECLLKVEYLFLQLSLALKEKTLNSCGITGYAASLEQRFPQSGLH